MGIHQLLAAAATTAAPATAAATQGSAFSAVDLAVNIGFIVWIVLATFGLLKLRVFHPEALRNAPPRAAIFLLPILIGMLAVYFLSGGAAYVALQVAGVLPPQRSASVTASGTQPATSVTATSPAAQPLPERKKPEMAGTPEQAVWLEVCGVVGELLAVAGAIALFPVVFRNGLAGAGLSPRQFLRGILLGLIGFLIIYPLLMGVDVALVFVYAVFHHVPKDQEVVEALENAAGPLSKMVDGIAAAVVAPFAEETVFRGTLQTLLIQGPGRSGSAWRWTIGGQRRPEPHRQSSPTVRRRWTAILITSATFGAIHFAPDQFPILFLLAVGLGYIYERTGNLFACMTVHALFNATTVVALLAK